MHFYHALERPWQGSLHFYRQNTSMRFRMHFYRPNGNFRRIYAFLRVIFSSKTLHFYVASRVASNHVNLPDFIKKGVKNTILLQRYARKSQFYVAGGKRVKMGSLGLPAALWGPGMQYLPRLRGDPPFWGTLV